MAEIGDFVYKNVFLYYTQKQWGVSPDEVDPSITARVPVYISRDNRYFQDQYQGMPAMGYTKLFENMLDHENIEVCLNTEAESVFDLVFEDGSEDACIKEIRLHDRAFTGPIVFTGPLDELFLARFGRLPYRSLDFVYETFDEEHHFPCATVNYTVTQDYTRDGVQAHDEAALPEDDHREKSILVLTRILRSRLPYYAIINKENDAHYARYRRLTESLPNFHPLGRLAEYRYYNMDEIVGHALELSDTLVAQHNAAACAPQDSE